MRLSVASGLYKGRTLFAPKLSTTRPTQALVRDAFFNSISSQIEESQMLDLFAGFGAIGLEAISRGASQATFVESHPKACDAIKKNIATLNVETQTRLVRLDCLKALERLSNEGLCYDLIFADPPYSNKQLYSEVITKVSALNLLKSTGTLAIECPKDYTPAEMQSLKIDRVKTYGSTKLIFIKN
jgi:16S rRNA (guanine966-N2)-methyltransferase